MSYYVEYNPELRKRYPITEKATNQKLIRRFIYAAVAVVGFYCVVQSGLAKLLLPGDPDATISAFSEMVTDVKSGNGVGDALLAFCKYIISNATNIS